MSILSAQSAVQSSSPIRIPFLSPIASTAATDRGAGRGVSGLYSLADELLTLGRWQSRGSDYRALCLSCFARLRSSFQLIGIRNRCARHSNGTKSRMLKLDPTIRLEMGTSVLSRNDQTPQQIFQCRVNDQFERSSYGLQLSESYLSS